MKTHTKNEVVFLNPRTCGIYKDGGTRYKTDPKTGMRTAEVDNELIEHVNLFLSGKVPMAPQQSLSVGHSTIRYSCLRIMMIDISSASISCSKRNASKG